MSRNLFQAGGPLLSSSPVYLQREADHRAADCLQKMQYITLIEGRQQGKTSLINMLEGEFSGYGYSFAVVDLMDLSSYTSSAETWYSALGQRILSQLTFRPGTRRLKAPAGSDSWEDFLADVTTVRLKFSQSAVSTCDPSG